MRMKQSGFGRTPAGEEVFIVTLVNEHGMGMEVTNYGAALVSVTVPSKDGKLRDVVLGYDDVTAYIEHDGYLGATIGRNGNRVKDSKIIINGKEYNMDKNEGENDLHSGLSGFNSIVWNMEASGQSVTFSLHSPDGHQGLPGNVDVKVTYTLTDANEVQIHYSGTSDADTILNMTNHSYFNLGGHDSGAVLGHTVSLDADAFTPVGEGVIPTGEITSVEGTPMDFRAPKEIGLDLNAEYEQLKITSGYDHNFVLNHPNEGIRKAAEVCSAESGIKMEVLTDCVGIQFYTGNFLEPARIGKGGVPYRKHGGFCLETQYYPDANRHSNFPSTILKAGNLYETATIYRFSTI